MNLFKITFYSVLKEHFFDLPFNINCDAREYVGYTNVDRYFDIEKVEREELVDIGLGVKISRPVVVERELKGGNDIFSSLSHNGILAVSYFESRYKYQLTDLVKERQIEIGADDSIHTGFYDNLMILLAHYRPLRVCSVEEIFLKKNMSVLEEIGNVEVKHWSDVSLLHSTRVLMLTSTTCIPYEYNVDAGVIRQLDIGKKTFSFASLTGIDVGVKGVFGEDGNNRYTYSLNYDNSTSRVLWCYSDVLCTFIPSSSKPGNIKKGMKIYSSGIFYRNTTERAQLATPFKHQYYQSIVRLFQDIFLVYDGKTKKWCLVKIFVP